jgi:charged multivesicular body protein 5
MADMLEQADEVQETLGRRYGTPDIDEDELLEAELEALRKWAMNPCDETLGDEMDVRHSGPVIQARSIQAQGLNVV